MHLSIDISEKISVLDSFYDKLYKSGHSHNDIRLLFIEALLKFNAIVEFSLLPADHPNYRPLYMSNEYDRNNRGIKKFLLKFNWFNPESNPALHAWKTEIPDYLKPSHVTSGKYKQNSSKFPCSSVLFVPNSNGSALLKRLEQPGCLVSKFVLWNPVEFHCLGCFLWTFLMATAIGLIVLCVNFTLGSQSPSVKRNLSFMSLDALPAQLIVIMLFI